MIETVLCVDIGTTSLKAGLISADGEVVSFSSNRYADSEDRFIAGKWIFALEKTVSDINKSIKSKNVKIEGIVISGNGPTVVSLSELTVRWNEQLNTEILGITKDQIENSLFMPKILAFRKLFSRDFEQSPLIFSGPEYLIYVLTGKAVTILPEKRFESAYWTETLLAKNQIPAEKMPPYVQIGHICGNLTADMAAKLHLPEGLPVISGGPDFVVALIGTKTLEPGRICDRCGSSEGFNFCIPEFIQHKGVRSLPSVIPGLWNASVLAVSSSQLTEKDRFNFAKGAVSILRNLADENKIKFPEQIIVTGGQAKNGDLMADKAKVLNMKLIACQCADAELLGDACAGFVALGKYQSLQEAAEKIVKEETIYENI